jgi:hypothetical protein
MSLAGCAEAQGTVAGEIWWKWGGETVRYQIRPLLKSSGDRARLFSRELLIEVFDVSSLPKW